MQIWSSIAHHCERGQCYPFRNRQSAWKESRIREADLRSYQKSEVSTLVIRSIQYYVHIPRTAEMQLTLIGHPRLSTRLCRKFARLQCLLFKGLDRYRYLSSFLVRYRVSCTYFRSLVHFAKSLLEHSTWAISTTFKRSQ
jgi:hypothetical protein